MSVSMLASVFVAGLGLGVEGDRGMTKVKAVMCHFRC